MHRVHQALGARFAPFGGWELPLYYRSILEEHRAVRGRVGLFDVSHLGHLELPGGEAAVEALQPVMTQDLKRLSPGRALYCPMLNERGGVIDEMILYRLDAERLRLVVNAANAEKVLGWLKNHLPAEQEIRDLRQVAGTLALQGPRALAVLEAAGGREAARLPRYAVGSASLGGLFCWIARTGYTGEDGCELFAAREDLPALWETLLKAGGPAGILPAGLGARDTLRIEAGLPLGGHELDEATTPLEVGLEWTVAWDKGDFIGKAALERQRREGLTRRLVGFELAGPGVARQGHPILLEGRRVGEVTSGTVIPRQPRETDHRNRYDVPGAVRRTDTRAIGMGYVEPALSRRGQTLQVEIHGRRVPARTVRMPFYERKRGDRT